jgi:hypothetical protein
MTAIATVFAAPLTRYSTLQYNPTFEIYGANQKGKTTLDRAVASFIGDPFAAGAVPTFAEFACDLDAAFARARDSVMFIDALDGSTLNGSASSASRSEQRLLIDIGSGRPRSKSVRTRYIGLATSNSPMLERVSNLPANQAQTLLDTFIEKRIEFVAQIDRLILRNHGKLYPKYVRALMRWVRETGEEQVEQYIDDVTREFRTLAAPATTAAGNMRVIDAFGLLWAGARKGHELGLLPEEFSNSDYLLDCYQRHLALADEQVSPMEQLIALVNRPDTVNLGYGERFDGSPEQLDRTAVTRPNKEGDKELLLSPTAMGFFFDFPRAIFNDPQVLPIVARDGRHISVHRPLTGRPGERYHAFKIDMRVVRHFFDEA